MKILMIGFNVQESIFPLAFSYLKSYAKQYYPSVDFKIKEFGFGTRFTYDTNANLELQTLSYILSEQPDMVCFSCYIWNGMMVKNICRALRKLTDMKIAVGGAEADESFKEFADYVVIGEGEVQFKRILDELTGKKKLTLADESDIVMNLDELPFPYRDYEGNKDFVAVRIETTRGCPFMCKYCQYAEKKRRDVSIPKLKEDIAYLFEHFTFKYLTILDANFNLNKKRMKEILAIIKTHSDKTIVNFELKPELIDEEVVSIIEESGLTVTCELGLQSIDDEVLQSCGRPCNLDKVKHALSLLNKSTIRYKIDLMYGLPKDTFFKFLRSVNFVKKYSRQRSLPAHHFMVLNNTKYHDNIRFIDSSSSMVIKTDKQDVTDLYKQKLFIDLLNAKKPQQTKEISLS